MDYIDGRFLVITNINRKDHPFVLDTKTMLIGAFYMFDYREKEGIEQMISDIANGRTKAVKVPGYSIFVTPKRSLVARLPNDCLCDILRDMAAFFKETIIDPKPHKWERQMDNYYPGMPGTWRPLQLR